MNPRALLRLAAAACCVALPAVPASAADDCFALPLSLPAKWISTVAWDSARQEIVLADPKLKRLVAVHPETGQSREISVTPPGSPQIRQPASVHEVGGRLFVRFLGSSGGFLDSTQKALSPLDRWLIDPVGDKASTEPAGSVINLLGNWVEAGGTLFGYGTLNMMGSNATTGQQPDRTDGVLLADFDRKTGQLSRPRSIDSKTPFDYYRLGYPYFAVNDLGFFYVQMMPKQSAALVGVTESASGVALRTLPLLPKAFESVRSARSDETGASQMAIFAGQNSIAGLYGGPGKDLYLLTKEASLTPVGTEWRLWKLDVEGQILHDGVRLPTSADHVTILRSPANWFVVERFGTGQTWGDQEIRSILRLPDTWITDPSTSPLGGASPALMTCTARTNQ